MREEAHVLANGSVLQGSSLPCARITLSEVHYHVLQNRRMHRCQEVDVHGRSREMRVAKCRSCEFKLDFTTFWSVHAREDFELSICFLLLLRIGH